MLDLSVTELSVNMIERNKRKVRQELSIAFYDLSVMRSRLLSMLYLPE